MNEFEARLQRERNQYPPEKWAKLECLPEYQTALQAKDIVKIGEIAAAKLHGNAISPKALKLIHQRKKRRKESNQLAKELKELEDSLKS